MRAVGRHRDFEYNPSQAWLANFNVARGKVQMTKQDLRIIDKNAPEDRALPADSRKLKWHWYHFYFVLAAFDLLVIFASVYVHHQTLKSFDAALADITNVHQQQRWLAELRMAIIELNAPGNSIFETGDLVAEVERFKQAKQQWKQLLHMPARSAPAPDKLLEHIESMIEKEEAIFAIFRHMDHEDPNVDRRELLLQASRKMASMDRAQAQAMAVLTTASLDQTTLQRDILNDHQHTLGRRTRIEVLFIAVFGLILLGMLWYGRKLQRTHSQLQRETRRVEEERAHRLAAVGEVCSSCAHGIRNPVASIASSAQLIAEFGNVDEATKRKAQDIVHTCHALNERITRLIGFARARELAPEGFDAREVVEQSLRETMANINAKRITVERRIDAAPVPVSADRSMLTQAMIELISNALDHLPDHGKLRLICTREGKKMRKVIIGVADNGPGISDEVKDRVTDLFFSLKPSGSGIGLASVRRIAEQHDGVVRITDVQPHGVEVTMIIPQVAM